MLPTTTSKCVFVWAFKEACPTPIPRGKRPAVFLGAWHLTQPGLITHRWLCPLQGMTCLGDRWGCKASHLHLAGATGPGTVIVRGELPERGGKLLQGTGLELALGPGEVVSDSG